MPNIDLSILNQRQTPAFFADTLANRPAAGFLGRIFVSTDTFAFYRDNGTGWDLIGGPGTGTITGSGTAGIIPLWNGASSIGNSDLRQLSSEALILNSATNDWPTTNFSNVDGRFLITSSTNNPMLILWGKSAFGSGDEFGSVALGNVTALGSTTFGGALMGGYIENGTDASGKFEVQTTNAAGSQTLALTINSTQNAIFYNNIGINTTTPGAAIDVHSGINVIQQLNQTIATNNSLLAFQNSGTGLWRIGNFYNSGANDWGIFDVVGAAQPFTIKKTTGQILIGTSSVGSGKLVVASSTSDNGIQIVGANAPSLRIDSSESGPTKRIGLGISTATNNFIQGSGDRDMCIFNGSTTASPMLFGIYDTTNVQEAARISAARNFLIGTTTDNGSKLQITGTCRITGNTYVSNNLGIGTITPNDKVEVTGNIRSSYTIDPTQYSYLAYDGLYSINTDLYIVAPSTKSIIFYANNTDRGRFTSGGNLLIGTTTDGGSKLQVNGSATINTTTSQVYSKLVVAGAICYNNNTNQAVPNNTYGMSFSAILNIVSNSGANTIYSSAGSEGALHLVSGNNLTTGARFVDLILYLGAGSPAPVVINSQIFGTPSARVYTTVTEALTLSLVGDANTYTVRITGMGANEKT